MQFFKNYSQLIERLIMRMFDHENLATDWIRVITAMNYDLIEEYEVPHDF